jgi:drug/metabolite transporter (DMT)-like permease
MIPPRLGAFIAILFWGVSFVATKAVLREISPVTLIFLRFAGAAVVLNFVVRRMPPRDSWGALALMGFVGVFVHQMLQAYALTMTSASHAGWLIGLTPIWSAILAAILLRERMSAWKVSALLAGFAGALLVITRGDLSTAMMSLPSTRGDLMIFISTFNWAIYSVIGHDTIRKLGPRMATAGMMTCGAAMLMPFFIAGAGWREIPHLSSAGWVCVAFLSLGCSAMGYLFWYGALEHVEVSRVAVLLYIEPLVTVAASVALLHETLSGIVIAGGLLVMASVIAMQYAPVERRLTADS